MAGRWKNAPVWFHTAVESLPAAGSPLIVDRRRDEGDPEHGEDQTGDPAHGATAAPQPGRDQTQNCNKF